jgi:hypothetical protein
MTEIGRKIIPATGRIRLLGGNAYIGKVAANIEVTFFESLDGLEAWINGQCVAVLRDYRTFKQIAFTGAKADCRKPSISNLFTPVVCPRIADASRQ